MPISRPLAMLVFAMAGVFLGADEQADRDANLRRLASMVREHRRTLAKNLEHFDALKSSEQESIRALDRELADLPEAERARFHAVLRRYHLWLQRLPTEKRDAIDAASPGVRMELINQYQVAERDSAARRRAPEFLKVVDLGDMSPIDRAQWLKRWLVLTPEERAEFQRIPPFPGPQLKRFLAELDPPRPITPPLVQITPEEEDVLVSEMRDIPEFRSWLPEPFLSRSPRNPDAGEVRGARKMEQRPESWEPPSPSGRRPSRMNMPDWWRFHCLAGNYYFIKNPPEPVKSTNLFRFVSDLPDRMTESFTYLPPEEAKRRLTILYRLIYPAPGDMPPPEKTPGSPGRPPTTPAGKAERAAPKPAPSPTGPNPF